MLPNTAINLLAPLVDVGLVPFALGACPWLLLTSTPVCSQAQHRPLAAGTVVGCLPNNFVAVSAGDRLNSMTSLSDMLDLRMLLIGGCSTGDVCTQAMLALRGCERRLWRGHHRSAASCHALPQQKTQAALTGLLDCCRCH